MQRLNVIVGLALICVASTLGQGVDPRGARPMEQGTRSEKCAHEKEWPFCTDDQWGSKCPSGCRIQGLIDTFDHETQTRVEKIRRLLDQNKAKHRSTNQLSKTTYDILREKLTLEATGDNNYYNLAQNLRQRISDMKVKIDRQLRILAALKDRVKDQVVEMQRLEVDIDIKLRSCKGSCKSYTEYDVDQESYVALEKQVNQLDSQSGQTVTDVRTLYVMKSRPLQGLTVDSNYKSLTVDGNAGQQRTDVFEDVKAVALVLESEGSPSSPATISKDSVCVRLMRRQDKDGRQPSGHMDGGCPATSDLALCSDDDWVSKCPSGCRLQGLISQTEGSVARRLRTVCESVRRYEDAAEDTMAAMTSIYSYYRRVFINRHFSELKFVEDADGLARNLSLLRQRSSRLATQLTELKRGIRKQVRDLYRTEVEIDMQLRACSGSCRSALTLSIDHLAYRTLQINVDQGNQGDQRHQTLHQRKKSATPPEHIPRVRLQLTDVGPPPGDYKSIPAVRRELLTQFEDIRQNQLVLEDLVPAEV